MSAVNICSDFGDQKNKISHCFHCFPIYLSSLLLVKRGPEGNPARVPHQGCSGASEQPPHTSAIFSSFFAYFLLEVSGRSLHTPFNLPSSNSTGHGTTDCFQIRKEVHQGCMLSLCLFNLYAEYIMRNTGLDEA